MPLDVEKKQMVLEYCERDLPDNIWFLRQFDFVDNIPLKQKLAQEFYAARYIYKLGEALSVDEARLHAHLKFQIMQYASIYEAIIVYLLWDKFTSHSELEKIQYHKTYKLAATFPGGLNITNADGEEVFLCVQRKEKTSTFSIKFDDKVDAAVAIGFVQESIGSEIKEFYRLRNAIHLETAIKKSIEYELGQAQLAYWRMQPFIEYIKAQLPVLLRDGEGGATSLLSAPPVDHVMDSAPVADNLEAAVPPLPPAT
ncbi:hypothetical protein [Xanthobacter sp. YC-JY1]|uniref:hypothetical protein n=1 Tax=Xanthobacter sp. YC-JY1 TaxID=2419844 RepID=UPI001F39CADD|nr:hypothetical protein [Xanthobacter sp. YC-JY1]